jgi:hypothetical protein
MVHRNFVNTQNTSLERDADGHRTGFKIYIKVRKPMSADGFRRYGAKARVNIGKSRFVWKYYSSSRAMNMPNGIPIAVCKTNKLLGEYLITFFGLSEGETYGLYGWKGYTKKKPLPVLTKCLAQITIMDVEKMAFKFTKAGRLERYYWRKTDKPKGVRQ